MIPFTKIDANITTKSKKLIYNKIKQVIKSRNFTSGKNVEKFEKNFAKFVGAKYCVSVNSGTTALFLSLLAIGIKRNDEVIIPGNSFISTAWAVSYCGAIPVFADVNKNDYLIDIEGIEKLITSRTKCILITHLYGNPVDVVFLKNKLKKNKLHIIEDSSQAHGSKLNNITVGGHGNINCFSFYPTKNLGAYGEGGAITTNNINIYRKIILYRNHAQKKKYVHEFLSYNFRFDEIQAGILNIKLKDLRSSNIQRNKIAKIYIDELKDLKDIQLPLEDKNKYSCYHLFVIHINNRNKLIKFLSKYKIQTGLHYPIPIHLQPAYSYLNYKKGDLKNCEYNARCCLSLPMYNGLLKKDVLYICDKIKLFFSKFNK